MLTLLDRDEVWNSTDAANGLLRNAAPVLAHASTGTFTLTYPAIVVDEIPEGADGYTPGGHTVALRAPHADASSGNTNICARAKVTAPNMVTVLTFDAIGTLADPPQNADTRIVVLAT